VATFSENFEDRSDEVLRRLEALPQKMTDPSKEMINLLRQEILAELVHIVHVMVRIIRVVRRSGLRDLSRR